jgi:hypothetical protein
MPTLKRKALPSRGLRIIFCKAKAFSGWHIVRDYSNIATQNGFVGK